MKNPLLSLKIFLAVKQRYSWLQIYRILTTLSNVIFKTKLISFVERYVLDGISYNNFNLLTKFVINIIIYLHKVYYFFILFPSIFKRKTNNLLIFNISNKSFRHYFTHEVINFNQENFKNLPKISFDIIIHSIKNKSSLIRTIESINTSKFSNIKIQKFFFNTCKYEFRDTRVIEFKDLKDHSDEFLFFLTSGDILDSSFFFDVYRFIARNSNAKVIYFNEHKILSGKKFRPIAKPCFSPDYLETYNYIGTNFIVAKSFEKDLAVLKKDNNFYKFLLNISAKVDGNSISLLNKFLIKSNNLQPNLSAGCRKKISTAINSYHKIIGINAKIRFFRDQTLISYNNFNPLVSIIIPASGNSYKGKDLLLVLLNSIFSNTDYTNYEIIIIDHDDLNCEHLRVINSHSNIKRVKLKNLSSVNDFNFSRNCNIAAKYARGDYFLFLNDDMKVINSSWLSYLVGHFVKSHTGIVGGKLLFPNNRIQHGGVGLLNGDPGHLYENMPHDFHAANRVKNLLAVTGACLMIKKDFFYDVGCFDETVFRTNYSDTDLCLKVISKLNKYVVYEPNCQLYHFASISRNDAYSNVNPEVISFFRDKWGFLFYDEFINSFYVSNLKSMKVII